MRSVPLLFLLAACGAPARSEATDDAGVPADAAPSRCTPLGDGWVQLGGAPLIAADATYGAIVGDPVPTVAYSQVAGGDHWVAAAAELGSDGSWHRLGEPLVGQAGSRLSLALGRDSRGVWLASYEVLSTTEFPSAFFHDTDVRLARWDGSAWQEYDTLNGVSAYMAWFKEQSPLPLTIAADGRILVAMRELVSEPSTDWPWPTRIRVASVDGAVTRQQAGLPGWDGDVTDRYPTALLGSPGQDVLVVTEHPGTAAATVFMSSGGDWSAATAGPLAGPHISAALLTPAGQVVLVADDGRTWTGDGTQPWRELERLPVLGSLQAMRTRTTPTGESYVAWVQASGEPAVQELRVARLSGESWIPLEIGLPPPLAGASWAADLSVDDCGRPLVLAGVASALEAWRFDGQGEIIP